MMQLQTHHPQNPQPQNSPKMLGRWKINPMLYVYVPILFVTPLYTYHMAVKNHEQKPWPWSTVTMTACHYPQDIVFRYFMLIASSMIALTFYIVFRWIQNQSIRTNYHKRLSPVLFYVTEFSMICYGVTIGTIDEKGTGPLHSPCAVIFFLIWMIVIAKTTIFMSKLRKWDSSVMSGTSLLIKKLLAFYVGSVWIYCIYGLITTSSYQDVQSQGDNLQRKSDMYVVILEWNSVLINLLWVLSFVFEWKELNFCLDFYPKSNQNITQNVNMLEQVTPRQPLTHQLTTCNCQNQQGQQQFHQTYPSQTMNMNRQYINNNVY